MLDHISARSAEFFSHDCSLFPPKIQASYIYHVIAVGQRRECELTRAYLLFFGCRWHYAPANATATEVGKWASSKASLPNAMRQKKKY